MKSLIALAVWTLLPSPALACGGFFCNPEKPIDQSGEKIVFAIDEVEDKVEVHVQIAFQGDAEDFAWVLPAPSLPELFLSSESLFSTLEWSTAPSYQMTYVEEGACDKDFRIRAAGDSGCWNCDYDGAFPASEGAGGVTVVAQQRVGPYESITLQATSADELVAWLQERNFGLPDEMSEALGPYLADDGYLVALRLANDADTGDLAPLGMRYAGHTPVIPIQLTSIAATPDMRLQPYVFSTGRAVPSNYLHVTLNDAAIDWFNNGSNYRDIVTRAANEAGGHAFATDFSGPTDDFTDLLYTDGQYDGLVAQLTDATLAEFMEQIASAGFTGTAELADILGDHLTLSPGLQNQGVQSNDVFNCPQCYEPVDYVFDAAACAAALDERILQPTIVADSLFERFAWLTRLTSSISPAEMDLDPQFVINNDMPAVERIRVASLVFECDKEGTTAYNAPRRLELPGGNTVPLPSAQWLDDNGVSYLDWVSEATTHANLKVESTSATSAPQLISDNSAEIGAALAALADEAETPVGGGDQVPTGCGCNGGAVGGGFGLSLLALLLGRRRSQD